MTTLVKDEFIKNLDTLPWMSEQTKRNAIEKVCLVTVKLFISTL